MAAAGVAPDPILSLQSSLLSLTSQEQLDAILTDHLRKRERNGFCGGVPITKQGKRQQIFKMLFLILLPVAILIGVTSYLLVDGISEKMDADKTKSVMKISIDLGELVHTLQQERDQSALYLSIIGSNTRFYLLRAYEATDSKLAALTDWPVELQQSVRTEFNSKSAFQRYLVRHRSQLGSAKKDVLEELTFYTDCMSIFMRWLYDALKETRYSLSWRLIVAYQKIVFCEEDAGMERALGSYFYSNGGFGNDKYYDLFNRQSTLGQHNYKVAQNYSPQVLPFTSYDIIWNGQNLSAVITWHRVNIGMRNITGPSVNNAADWFDTMTLYMNILSKIQSDISAAIFQQLEDHISKAITKIILTALTMAFVLGLCPVMSNSIVYLTSDIQRFAKTLADKTRELRKEKTRTDTLLYQMLPKTVAEELKTNKGTCDAEYFKQVTIFFADIDGFTELTLKLSPMQSVHLLNSVFSYVDERIEQYDVYKVETIGSSYMVASGLPTRNKKHASEIANMSLDLVKHSQNWVFGEVTERCIRLRIGLHSGPAVAGVIGNERPRYCIFGDTVNTASRMQTSGMPGKIHVSDTTFHLLSKKGDYRMHKRGQINIKGKGEMTTYWLYRSRNFSPVNGGQSTSSADNASLTVANPCFTSSTSEIGDELEELKVIQPRFKRSRTTRNSDLSQYCDTSASLPSCSTVSYPLWSAAATPCVPSYEELEHELDKMGSPPVLQLTEGVHY